MKKEQPEERMLGAIQRNDEKVRAQGFQAGIKVGRAQAITAIRDRLSLAVIKQWIDIKKDKPWLATGETWEDWAKPHLGYSYKHIDEAIKNVQAIGEELYEILEAIDVQQKDLVAMRRAIERGAARIEGSVLIVGRHKFDLSKDHKAIKEFVDELQATLTAAKEEAARAIARAKAKQDEAREEAKTLQAALAQAQDELKKWQGAKVPGGIVSEAEREVWLGLLRWYESFKAWLIVFDERREAGQLSDAAVQVLIGLCETIRDAASDAIEASKHDLAIERPRFTRVK